MSAFQKKPPEDPNPKQESGPGNAQTEAVERTSLRVGLALASAAVGGAVRAFVEHFLKDDQ